MSRKMKRCIFLNSMNDTLQLLDELLSHDSGSRIFFPLARLYRKQGNSSRAIEIVRKGLEAHPDYLEARLLLIELLHDSGACGEAEEIAQSIHLKLFEYAKFWTSLRSFFAKSDFSELLLASFMFEQAAKGARTDLLSLLRGGMMHYADSLDITDSVVYEPDDDLDADEVTQICINSGIKTKTMAKLLASQGEYQQALTIYDELIAKCSDSEEEAELCAYRARVQNELAFTNVPGSDHSSKIYNLLDSLASRLEKKTSL